jgi:DNA-directed RNA polymerase subunit E'/Rpb7
MFTKNKNKQMRDIIKIDDIQFLKNKTDLALEKFLKDVEDNKPINRIIKSYNSLIRIQNQMKIAEDSIVIYSLAKNGNIKLIK